MMYKSFDKKSTGGGIKNEIKKNQQLANQLHKSTVRMFKKKKNLLSIERQYLWCRFS